MTHIKLQILKLINNVFVLNARLIIYFLELHHTCEIYIFERVTQLAHPSALLCQSSRSYMLALELTTVYKCKTAAIVFIYLSIVSMILKLLNPRMYLKS
jgi:hypothetical protein